MKKIFALVCFLATCLISLNAQNATPIHLNGEWQATWNTGIGIINSTYTFTVNGNSFTGKVVSNLNGEKSESEITDGKIDGEIITFSYQFQGNIKMAYKGTVSGDEIKFTRDAGGFATEEATAKRPSK